MLRPEFHRVQLGNGEVRYVFGLLRKNQTRKVFATFTRLRRRTYPGETYVSPRGFEFGLKVFK